jgi:aspartyl-tRNA(Asn)/glutamyl-tRNA(Gln) amidotransferase subunit A
LILNTDDTNTGTVSLSILEQQYANTRTQLFGDEVIRRILCGTYVLSAEQYETYYEPATQIRAQITQQFHTTFTNYDLLLLPTTLYPPPKINTAVSDTTISITTTTTSTTNTNTNTGTTRMDPTEMLANDIMTVPISLTGCPAISVSIRGSTWYNNTNKNNDNNNNNSDDGIDEQPPDVLTPPFQISMQLVGPRMGESTLLLAASVLEQYTETNP